MPDPRPLTGLYGKVPAHGDFVRRGLPSSFVTPWDSWLAAGIAVARGQLGAQWEAAWDSAPAWRFALPPGACGPDAVAGVMLPSQDQVGRRFPITLAALLPPGAPPPDADWFDALEAAALAGQAGRADADALSAALPVPGAPILAQPFALPPIMPAASPPPAEPEAAPWPAAEPAPPNAPIQPAEDVLALLATPAAPMGSGHDDDALAFLMGAAARPAAPIDPDGTLAGLIGAGTGGVPRVPDLPAAPPAGDDDALAHLISAGAGSPPLAAGPAAPSGVDDDALARLIGDGARRSPHAIEPSFDPGGPGVEDHGTLAALIGVGAGSPVPGVTDPQAALPGESDDAPAGLGGAALPADSPDTVPIADADVLGALIGSGADAAGAEPASVIAPGCADPGPAADAGPDLLPETVAMTWPDLAEPADLVPAIDAVAPPAPEGGGWWTRGGAHVPPMVWPLPGLPDPADFAYLLEAAA